MSSRPHFDDYARNYRELLQKSLSATGESPEYFARKRVCITRERLKTHSARIARIVDFGCGLGTAVPYLIEQFEPVSVTGIDVSREILKEAAMRNRFPKVSFSRVDDFAGTADLVFCNGVFHHVPPEERARALQFVRRALEPDGFFAFWENNPLNPGTRHVMSRCAFDRDALTIAPGKARKMLRAAGFEIMETTSAFFFPRALGFLRRLEGPFAPTLLGGQYLVLARRSAADQAEF
jgi:SAM-dependent methyltransferase